MALIANIPLIKFVNCHKITNPAEFNTIPKIKAPIGGTFPVATCLLCFVLSIFWSISRSQKLLIELAPPAVKAPPISTDKVIIKLGHPSDARNKALVAVTSRSIMILGLVTAKYKLIICIFFLIFTIDSYRFLKLSNRLLQRNIL